MSITAHTASGNGIRRLGAVAALASALAVLPAAPTDAAPPARVDVTVAESIPVTGPGSVTAASGLDAFGCLGAEVTTTASSVSTRGDVTRFSGTKDIACADGTLSISFRARVRGCAPNDRGIWRVTGGTGVFEDARGGGRLVGTYTGGDACTATGIDDRYRGVVRVP